MDIEGEASMDVAAHVETKARAAKEAAAALALAPTRAKNEALQQMARGLEEKTPAVLEANRADLDRARSAGLTRASLDRLTLTEARIEEMAVGLRHVAGLPDPVGETVEGLAATERCRDRAGSRPPRRHRLHLRVPPQCHRGCRRPLPQIRQCGAAAWRQRGARVQHDHRAHPGEGGREGGPAGRRHPVHRHADRAAVMAMLTLDRYLDLIIPRGGEEFVRLVAERATVPVLKHDKGLCHVYVDEGADLDMALAIV
jgi:glutamate-5-semialdehyde dehydrogenase